MAENTKNVEFKNPHPELPVREPILKLGKMVTDRAAIKLGLEKLTADDPEYWGLAAICTDEMAEVALKMGVRKPKTLPELVKITGMDEKYLEELITGRIQSTRNSMCFLCLFLEVRNLPI